MNIEVIIPNHPAQFHRPDIVKQPLYVITPYFNPERPRSRMKLYKDFENYVLSNNEAVLITIECAFGEREYIFTEPQTDRHKIIHVRTKHEIWIKENLINLAIQQLPESWKYVAWIDADIQFARPDWVGETIQQLQHFDVVQMFSHAHDLGPDYQMIKSYTGFVYCYQNQNLSSVPSYPKRNYISGLNGQGYWHPGFAWACTKNAFINIGGLIDWGILGGGDTYMAYCLAGMLNQRIMPRSLGKSGIKWLIEWQNRCEKYVRKNIGYIDGALLHHWHGKRENRGYKDRGQMLTESNFDPEVDLKRDWNGLWQLTDRAYKLRDNIRYYFRRRNEDSIDL